MISDITEQQDLFAEADEQARRVLRRLDTLIALLAAQRFDVSVDRRTKAQFLLVRHLSEFGARELSRLKHQLCPVFAVSAAQQDIFYRMFDRWDQPDATPEVLGDARVLAEQSIELSGQQERRSRWRFSGVTTLVGLAAVGIASAAVLDWDTAIRWFQSLVIDRPGMIEIMRKLVTSPLDHFGEPFDLPDEKVQITQTLTSPLAAPMKWALTALPFLVFATWLVYCWRHRLLWMNRGAAVDALDDGGITIPELREHLFAPASFRETMHNLNSHQRIETDRIAVRPTVKATAEEAGLFTPRFKTRPVSAGYLIMIEQRSVHDHLVHLIGEAVDRLRKQHILVQVYYYISDPRAGWIDDNGRTPSNLSELANRLRDYRLVAFGNSDDFFFSGSAEPYQWVRIFDVWTSKTLLNTRPLNEWTDRELKLMERGFSLATASGEGIAALGEGVRSGLTESRGVLLQGQLLSRGRETRSAETTTRPEDAVKQSTDAILEKLTAETEGRVAAEQERDQLLEAVTALQQQAGPQRDEALKGRDLDKAEKTLLNSLALEKELGRKEGMASHYGNLGLIHQMRGDVDKAEEMHLKALALNEVLGRKEGMASDYSNLGLIHETRGDLDKAAEMFLKALALDEELGRKEGMASTYGNLGVIHQTRGDLDKAEEMHLKALALDEELGRKEGMASDYGNLGVIHKTRGDLDKAEEMHLKALALDEELGRKEGIASDYGNLGLIHETRGDLDKAEEMHLKALALDEELGRKEGMASDYGNPRAKRGAVGSANLGKSPNSDSPLVPSSFTLFRDAPDTPEMIPLPTGKFWMGSPDDEDGRSDVEGPRHEVEITQAFAIGRYPVTFEQYVRFCEETRWELPADEDWGRGERPVINVDRNDADAYCEWLSRRVNLQYRLPSEAEWEYACRAGTDTPYPWGAEWDPVNANAGGQQDGTTEVGRYPANIWSLYDTTGNVWEWCSDEWTEDYSKPRTQTPFGSRSGDLQRVVRGGSWDSSPRNLRSADRSWSQPGGRFNSLGFRVARTLSS